MASAATEFPRTFLPADLVIAGWPDAEPHYRALLERPVASREAFERWLSDWSELDAAFSEARTTRYVAMTCATDDSARERAYLDFIENVEPKREPVAHALRQRCVELADRFPLPPRRYEVLLRSTRNAIGIYRDENVPLQTEDSRLRQQYQKIVGAMTVQYGGKELTLPQLMPYLEETDRAVREETWRLGSDRYLQDAARLDALYADMVRVRDQIARNAGCPSYVEYAFRMYERFDYTPDDCRRFHDAIEKTVVPAAAQLASERRRKLGLSALRPWDMAVDPDQNPPLRPFETIDRLSDGCAAIFRRISPGLANVFDALRERGLLDLDSRKGKAPGGYQEVFNERRLPFIFMNAVGTESDVQTLLHEGGHAFHSWACRNDPLLAYRNYPTEFAEVASMGMECLAMAHLEEFYGADARLARRHILTDIIDFLPYMARVDAMQHYVYTHPDAGIDAWKDEWQRLTRRFNAFVDWSGLETYDRHAWQRKLHFYEAPFYYVEYGIAQLGALQLWVRSRQNADQAVAEYRAALALGGSRPLPELFETAGLEFDFSERTLRPLVGAMMEELARL